MTESEFHLRPVATHIWVCSGCVGISLSYAWDMLVANFSNVLGMFVATFSRVGDHFRTIVRHAWVMLGHAWAHLGITFGIALGVPSAPLGDV